MHLFLFIFLIIDYILALNYFNNHLISVDLDICGALPVEVNSRYIPITKSLIFEVSDRKKYKIGNVYENGILIYPDSDILIFRKVIRLMDIIFDGYVIQVNSIYCKKVSDCISDISNNNNNQIDVNNQVKEAIEFVRHPGDNVYREIVRKPNTLNVRPNTANSQNILVKYHNYHNNDDSRIKVSYDIRNKDLLRHMIGIVKYGDLIIDDSVYGIIYKSVDVTFNTAQGIIVGISKIMKEGCFTYSKCKILFVESRPDECQVIHSYSRQLI